MSPMSRIRNEQWIAALFASVVAVGCDLAPNKPARETPKAAPVVIVSQPVSEYVTDYEDFTGRTEAVHSVEIRARVSGYLDKVNFKDGDEVKEGDILFEIDPRPYKGELDRVEATLAQSEAHQKRLDADYRRAQNLFSRGNISREEFDTFSGDRTAAAASVGVARASFDLARLNMKFTKINAPISGRLSRRLVDPGNLVKNDETPLTTIVSLDPIHVYFDVDERTMLRYRRLVNEGKVKSRTEAEIPVLVGLSDEEGYPHRGTIDFSDNKVDPGTGTLRVRARLQNPKPRVFSPGLFTRVRLPVGNPRRSILIDEQAMGTDQGQKFLYVVNDKDEVVYRPVKVGRLVGGKRVIQEGLSPGERVVVSGLQRIRNHLKVNPKNQEEKARLAGKPDTVADHTDPPRG
ncbi:MAG: efflux RND transporter periplasmic adaptor subunit [Isosphaeraceae bacterium]